MSMKHWVFPPRGIVSFAGAPLVTPGASVDADVIVIGVPWDGGTGLRGGARHGPRAIREASQRFPLWQDRQPTGYWDVTTGQQRLAGITVVDGGDVPIVRASQEYTAAAITATVRAARRSAGLLLLLGGDHSLTFPAVQAFDDCGTLGIIQLDAHLDFTDAIDGGRFNSSTALRRVSELPFVGAMAAIGLRGLRTARAAYAAAEARGNLLVTRDALRCLGPDVVLERLPPMQQAYLTIDLDVLDPTLAPAVSAPELDGLGYDELRRLVSGIARRSRIVALDIVELSPPHDPAGLTALAAAQLAVELLAVVCENNDYR